jgi:hypothetical protein
MFTAHSGKVPDTTTVHWRSKSVVCIYSDPWSESRRVIIGWSVHADVNLSVANGGLCYSYYVCGLVATLAGLIGVSVGYIICE